MLRYSFVLEIIGISHSFSLGKKRIRSALKDYYSATSLWDEGVAEEGESYRQRVVRRMFLLLYVPQPFRQNKIIHFCGLRNR